MRKRTTFRVICLLCLVAIVYFAPNWIWLLLLALVVGLLLFVFVLIVLPVRYTVQANTAEGCGKVRARYLFGLVRAEYVYVNGEGNPKIKILWKVVGESRPAHIPVVAIKTKIKKVKRVATKAKEAPAGALEKFKKYFAIAREKFAEIRDYPNRAIITELALASLKKMAAHMLPTRLNIKGEVGFTCPANTGMFFAGYGVTREFLKNRRNRRIDIRPNFDTDTTVFNVTVMARGRIIPLRLLYIVAALAIKKPMRKLIGDLME